MHPRVALNHRTRNPAILFPRLHNDFAPTVLNESQSCSPFRSMPSKTFCEKPPSKRACEKTGAPALAGMHLRKQDHRCTSRSF